jgi:type II secretion system protein C
MQLKLPPAHSLVPGRRAWILFAALTVSGLASGAAANRFVVAPMLVIPDDAGRPAYEDAPASSATGPSERAAGDGPAVEEPRDEPVARVDERPRALPKSTYVDAIVRRNIFDSTATPAAATDAVGAGDCKSTDSARLLATMVADPVEYSSALIALGSGKDAKADGYAIGDTVGSEGRITLIEQKKVCLDAGGCLCIGSEGAAKNAARDEGKGAAEGGVEKLADNKFVVEQSVLDEAMGNFESLAGQIRVVPHKDASGNVDGYRLSAIRRGSLFDKLGIKNGDVVHAANGQALTSTEGALSVYNTLKNERSFSFEISRRNQRQTLEYEVR